jgi:hypothetical protein
MAEKSIIPAPPLSVWNAERAIQTHAIEWRASSARRSPPLS